MTKFIVYEFAYILGTCDLYETICIDMVDGITTPIRVYIGNPKYDCMCVSRDQYMRPHIGIFLGLVHSKYVIVKYIIVNYCDIITTVIENIKLGVRECMGIVRDDRNNGGRHARGRGINCAIAWAVHRYSVKMCLDITAAAVHFFASRMSRGSIKKCDTR